MVGGAGAGRWAGRGHSWRLVAYALYMSRTRPDSGARRKPWRTALLCVAVLGASTSALAPTTAGTPAAQAAGSFDVSAWAPWWQAADALKSFNGHSGQFGELSPFFFSAIGDGSIATNSVGSFQLQSYKNAAHNAVKPLIPTVVDGNGAHVMAGILADPGARANHIQKLVEFVVNGEYDGVDLDYEQFAFADGVLSWPTTTPLWDVFIQELSGRLHALTPPRSLAVSVPPIGPGIGNYPVYDYPMLGQYVDRIRIMTYSYSTGKEPGPIAPYAWVSSRIDAAIAAVGAANAGKIVMGIPLYGTDWVTAIDGSCPRIIPSGMRLRKASYQTSEFPALAQRKGVTPLWNGDLQERTFTYTDSIYGPDGNGFNVRCNVSHTVFYVDPDGVFARMALAKSKGIAGVSFWALGNDDAATWTSINAAMAGSATPPGYVQLIPSAVAPPLPAIVSPLPARFLETRPGYKTIDGQYELKAFRPADTTTEVQIAGRSVVPSNVTAVALNVTAVGEGDGFVTVYPCGDRPATSNLNVHYGQVISNTVITKLSPTGTICIYNQGRTQLIVDLFDTLSTTAFTPVSAPARILDTRPGQPTSDGALAGVGAMTQGTTLEVPVSSHGNMTASQRPAVLNVTVDGATTNGYLTLWPCGTEQPKTSNLNYSAGTTMANAVVTALGANGSVCVYSSGTTHVIIDTFGELSASSYTPLPQPARLLDTRAGYTTFDGSNAAEGVRSALSTLTLPVGGRAGLADQPAVLVLNVTVDGPATSGFITVYPCGGARPNVSNVNYAPGQTLPNLVVTGVSASGTICLYTSVKTHLIVDVFGSLSL